MFLFALFIAQFGLSGMLHEEDEHDRQVLKALAFIDAAMAHQRTDDQKAGIAKVKQLGARGALEKIIKLREPEKRALGVLGYRMLGVRSAWPDLQMLLLDPAAIVRRQVLFYVAREPQGVSLDDVSMLLRDGSPDVRMAAVQAVVSAARRPEQAGALLKAQLLSEKNANVARALRIGLTELGLPSQ